MDKIQHIVILVPPCPVVISSVVGTYQLLQAAIQQDPHKKQLTIAGVPSNITNGPFSLNINKHWLELDQTDLIIIPALEGYPNLDQTIYQELIEWLKDQYTAGAHLASLCSGVEILAIAGLLTNKKCTTHWAYGNELKNRHPEIRWQRHEVITEDHRIFTSGGAYSFLNLILYLIERLWTKELAWQLAGFFQIDYARKSQAPFTLLESQKRHQDHVIQELQEFIEAHYTEKIAIEGLANRVQLGQRTMVRRFKAATGSTPGAYLQRVRIEATKHLLLTTNRSIGEIQEEVGYSDPKNFRRIFSRYTGMLPKQYRRRYA